MIHESNRLMNKTTACTGILAPQLQDDNMKEVDGALILSAQAAEISDKVAAEHLPHYSPHRKCADKETNDAMEDCSDSLAKPKLVSFQPTAQKSILDDWLHRGPSLYDVPLFLYARHFERVQKPKCSTSLSNFQRRFGAFFHFDHHYELSPLYVQIRRQRQRRVRIVGPNCPRASVCKGEDNAMYKSLFFSLVHCSGEGHCCNPTNYCLSLLVIWQGLLKTSHN